MELKHLEHPFLEVQAVAGARLSVCIKEAIIKSLELYIPIQLIHNSKVYGIDPEAIIDNIRFSTERITKQSEIKKGESNEDID